MPSAEADFRCQAQDFSVVEDLGFEPSGDGEHLYLLISKTGQNTHWVAQQLAQFAGVKPLDIGYSGRKDRHACTRQWFSIYLPQQRPLNWENCHIPNVTIEKISRHQHKLRLGQHRANHFSITLRNLKNGEPVTERLEHIAEGVPNYFGEQRFGRDGNNLHDFHNWVEKRAAKKSAIKLSGRKRGLILSAARSFLFNCVLSERVKDGTWRTPLDGDVDAVNASGPLWGRGSTLVAKQTGAIEHEVLEVWENWCTALEYSGLKQERRPLVCRPMNFSYQLHEQTLALTFTLTAGQYATAVLREIAVLHNRASAMDVP